jgi:hypothetical protein
MKIYSSHKTISEQFENLTTLPMFEIETIDKRTKEQEHIIFNISIQNNKFIAQHVALNEAQQQSNKIAFCSTSIDSFFSLDENLQDLYDECIQAIIESTFYELPE